MFNTENNFFESNLNHLSSVGSKQQMPSPSSSSWANENINDLQFPVLNPLQFPSFNQTVWFRPLSVEMKKWHKLLIITRHQTLGLAKKKKGKLI